MRKIGSLKNTNTRLMALLLSGVTLCSMAGCSKGEEKKKIDNSEVTLSSSQLMNNYICDELEENNHEKYFEISEETEKTFAALLNLDYIVAHANNEKNDVVTALSYLFDNTKIVDEFFEDYEKFIDAYRAYILSLNDSSKFIGLSGYLLNDEYLQDENELECLRKDKLAFKGIEDLTKRSMDTTLSEEANEIFSLTYNFFVNGDSIKVDGIDIKKSELSYGVQLVLEEYAKIININVRSYVNEEKRVDLDNSLNALSSKSKMNANLVKFNTNSVDLANLNINLKNVVIGEADPDMINLFNAKCENLKTLVNATDEEISAAVILSNMNYIDVTTLKTLIYENGGSVDVLVDRCNSFISKLVKSDIDTFDPYFKEDEDYISNYIVTQGTLNAIRNISASTDKGNFDSNGNVIFLTNFLACDPKCTFNYDDSKYGYNSQNNAGNYITYKMIENSFESICPSSDRLSNIRDFTKNYNPEDIIISDIQSKCGESYVKAK